MFIVVVMALDGTVRLAVGPFWEEGEAERWGGREVEGKRNMRFTVRPLTERRIFEGFKTS